MFIAAEPQGGGDLKNATRKKLTNYVDRYRLAGQEIKLEGPDYVPLDIALTICVDPNYFRTDVEKALMQVLGRTPPGFFTDGKFQLGETVYLSRITTAARAVAGVQKVTATLFQPQGVATKTYLQKGEIPLGPFQVARMDNDRSYPNHGRLTLTMEGGK
jgi:hypothetical protein